MSSLAFASPVMKTPDFRLRGGVAWRTFWVICSYRYRQHHCLRHCRKTTSHSDRRRRCHRSGDSSNICSIRDGSSSRRDRRNSRRRSNISFSDKSIQKLLTSVRAAKTAEHLGMIRERKRFLDGTNSRPQPIRFEIRNDRPSEKVVFVVTSEIHMYHVYRQIHFRHVYECLCPGFERSWG
jgi:hypothetical protein